MSDAVPATTDAAPAPAETTAPETAATAPPATAAAPAAAATLSFVPGEAGSAATKAVLSSTEERAAAIKRQVRAAADRPLPSSRTGLLGPPRQILQSKRGAGSASRPCACHPEMRFC
jgi:hypothetical protein